MVPMCLTEVVAVASIHPDMVHSRMKALALSMADLEPNTSWVVRKLALAQHQQRVPVTHRPLLESSSSIAETRFVCLKEHLRRSDLEEM